MYKTFKELLLCLYEMFQGVIKDGMVRKSGNQVSGWEREKREQKTGRGKEVCTIIVMESSDPMGEGSGAH